MFTTSNIVMFFFFGKISKWLIDNFINSYFLKKKIYILCFFYLIERYIFINFNKQTGIFGFFHKSLEKLGPLELGGILTFFFLYIYKSG